MHGPAASYYDKLGPVAGPTLRIAGEGDAPDEDPTPLPVLWLDEIEPCLDVRDFVQGVLVDQGAVVIYGESNSGKTFWTTDLALHIAAGKPWNGRRVDQGGVIYCVLEGGAGFRNRVAAWRKTNVPDGTFVPFAAVPASLNLLDAKADTPRLIEAIKSAAESIGMPVKLVVIDTLSRAMAGGNENAPDDMGALVRNMDKIREETGACVAFVHHSGKDQAKGARGHSLLRAAIDTEVEVIASEDTGERTATVVKQRELRKGDAFGFTLAVTELGTNRHNEPVTTCLVTPCEPTDAPRQKGKVRLPDGAALAVRALHIALTRSGAHLPPGADYPTDTIGVAASEWRNEFYQLKGASPDTNKHAFSRAEMKLLAAGIITERNGLAWFVKRENDGTN